MKKLKNLKARLLSLSLAFAMVLSLAMGMAPIDVHAEDEPVVQDTGSNIPCNENVTIYKTREATENSNAFFEVRNIYNIDGELWWKYIPYSKGDKTIEQAIQDAKDEWSTKSEYDATVLANSAASLLYNYGNSYGCCWLNDNISYDAYDYLVLLRFRDIDGNPNDYTSAICQVVEFAVAELPKTVSNFSTLQSASLNLNYDNTFGSDTFCVGEYDWSGNSGLSFNGTFSSGYEDWPVIYNQKWLSRESADAEWRVVGSSEYLTPKDSGNLVGIQFNIYMCKELFANNYENDIKNLFSTVEGVVVESVKVTRYDRAYDTVVVTLTATPHQHSWSEYTKDAEKHSRTCSGCSEVEEATHTDADTNNACDVCGYNMTPATPPAANSYGITLDRTNYPEGYVELYTYASGGSNVATTQINNTTIQMPEGGKVRIFAGEDFTVTAAGATISERKNAGEEGYYYELTNITAATTVVVNKVTSGDEPTPDPGPTVPGSGNNNSSSGSSLSSSSSSTPSTSTPSTAPITVPVSNGGNDNVLNINASLSGETAKVNELTAEEIDKVAKNGTKDSIEINLSETGKTVKEAALPVSSLNEIARIMDDPSNKLDNVTIKLSTATVEISEHALKAVLSKTSGNDLRLVVDDIHKDTLNNTQKESVKNQNVHMCIDAYFISNGVRIGDFQGGTATIRLPFNVPAGHNRNGFSVWYVGDDGTIEKHDTQYVNGELVFTVSHFSDYVVVYDGAVKDNVPKTGEAADYTTLVWTSILAIGVLGLVLNRQKRRQ